MASMDRPACSPSVAAAGNTSGAPGLRLLVEALELGAAGGSSSFRALAAVAELLTPEASSSLIPRLVDDDEAEGEVLAPTLDREGSEQQQQQEHYPPGVARAFGLVEAATRLLDGGLHRCSAWGEVKDLFFHAGALFAEAGMHGEAAEAFNSSAAICRIYGDPLETATAIGFTIDSCKFCDPMQAAALLREQLEIFKAAGRTLHAAKCVRDLGKISEQLGLDEDAVGYYTQAIELFGDSNPTTRQLSRPCKSRVAHITAQLGRFKDAAAHFEHLAATCVPPVAPTLFYFKAVLCLLADAQGERYAGGIAKAKARFLEFQDLDPELQKGVENKLVRAIIAAFDKPSLSSMDAAFAGYRDMRSGDGGDGRVGAKAPVNVAVVAADDEWFEQIGAAIRDNLFQYLLPFM